MQRFFFPQTDFSLNPLKLFKKDELHHILNVLRLKKGDPVCLFNGNGKEALGLILSITSQEMLVNITSVRDIAPIEPLVTLACALPKKAKFEIIIEKATELGVDEIIPLITQRTEIILKNEKLQKKYLRYQTVAVNAAKQCQRAILPRIHEITEFEQALNVIDKKTKAFIPWLEGDRQHIVPALKEVRKYKKVIFFIGPEGDFTADEIKLASEAGCVPLSLGSTVLKVDTAAVTVIAAANLLLKTQNNK